MIARRSCACKNRIENDQIPRRRGVALAGEPIEDIDANEFSLHHVTLGILLRLPDRIERAVKSAHHCRPGPRAMHRKRSLIAERIEHPPAFRVFRYRGMLEALVQIKSRLVSFAQIDPIAQVMFFDKNWPTR